MSPCVLPQKEQKSAVTHPALKLFVQLLHLLWSFVQNELWLYSPLNCLHHIVELFFLVFQYLQRGHRIRRLNDALTRCVILGASLGFPWGCLLLRGIGSLIWWGALSPILSISRRRVFLVGWCSLRVGWVGGSDWDVVTFPVLLLSLINLFDQIIFNFQFFLLLKQIIWKSLLVKVSLVLLK